MVEGRTRASQEGVEQSVASAAHHHAVAGPDDIPLDRLLNGDHGWPVDLDLRGGNGLESGNEIGIEGGAKSIKQ